MALQDRRQLGYTPWGVHVATNGFSGARARFDRFNVDLSTGKLQRSGVDVPVQGKPFQVLRLLLMAKGEVVSREQLRAVLWPEDTFVDFEHGVNTAVKKLRQAIEDSAENPKFVETLPKIGYRFIASVEWVADAASDHGMQSLLTTAAAESMPIAQSNPRKRRRIPKTAIALTGLLVIAAAIFFSAENGALAHSRLGRLLRGIGVGHRSPTQASIPESRLTANPDDTPVTSGVISPDGKLLAYSDATGLYVRQVDNGETHPIPLPKGFNPLAESWCPDGVHLVVSWVESLQSRPSLWQISVMGGAPRKLTDEGSSASLSPDGSQVSFVKQAASAEEVWLMQANGDRAKRLIRSEEDSFSRAAWARDGKRLAYARTKTRYYASRRAPDTRIEVFNLSTGQTVVVRSVGDRGLPRGGAALGWTPDGRLLYPLREPRPNQQDTNLWSVRLDSETAHPLGPSARITSGRGIAVQLSLSNDGRRIALRRHAPQPDVYVADLERGDKRLSTPRRLTLDERLDYATAWTADSKAVVFYSNRDGPFHIFKQSIDATQPELLVGGKDDLYAPRVSPDGSSVVYVVRTKAGGPSDNAQVMRVPLAGGPPQLVLEAPDIFDVECTRFPSKLCIYGQIQAGQKRFFTFDPVKGKGIELSGVESKDDSFNWCFSPDGKYFAWPSNRTTQKKFGVRIFSLAGELKRDIAVPGWAEIYGLDWAADSTSLWACARDTKDKWALLNIGLDGKVRTMLSYPNLNLEWAIPSPDGRHLAIVEDSNTSNVWLLENF
ncbi:MAG: LpqB family beta-propeller domain-containing protein [Bryobacteraceae bacterium]